MSDPDRKGSGCLPVALPLILIVGGISVGWWYLNHRAEAEEQKKAEAFASSPDGYKPKVQVHGLKLEVRQNNTVFLFGRAVNTGDRQLSNVRVKLFFMTQPMAGESRPPFADLGPFAAGESREIEQALFTIPSSKPVTYGGHYRVDLDSVSFQ